MHKKRHGRVMRGELGLYDAPIRSADRNYDSVDKAEAAMNSKRPRTARLGNFPEYRSGVFISSWGNTWGKNKILQNQNSSFTHISGRDGPSKKLRHSINFRLIELFVGNKSPQKMRKTSADIQNIMMKFPA